MLSTIINKCTTNLAKIRYYLYEQKIIKPVVSKLPVISVGNLSFGGSGKTPFVITLVNFLKNNGFNPIVLSRGYKSETKEILISDTNSNYPIYSVGDECYLIQKRTERPVIISKKKFQAIPLIEELNLGNVIVIDDGFQHRKISRNIDIVLLDKQIFKSKSILLRENFDALNRANVIAIENGNNIDAIRKHLKQYHLVIRYQKKILGFFDINANEVSTNHFVGKKVSLISGIANNKSFYKSIKTLGIDVFEHFEFRDHQSYNERIVKKVIKKIDKSDEKIILTTEKDFWKLSLFSDLFQKHNIQLYSSYLDLEITYGGAEFEAYLLAVLNAFSKQE